jgi:hypothetical protein
VHVIVEAEVRPEKVMNDFKAYGQPSIELARRREAKSEAMGTPWKARDGCGRIRMFGSDSYVVEEQGEPIAVFLGDVP